jgi:hypothetical protein
MNKQTRSKVETAIGISYRLRELVYSFIVVQKDESVKVS